MRYRYIAASILVLTVCLAYLFRTYSRIETTGIADTAFVPAAVPQSSKNPGNGVLSNNMPPKSVEPIPVKRLTQEQERVVENCTGQLRVFLQNIERLNSKLAFSEETPTASTMAMVVTAPNADQTSAAYREMMLLSKNFGQNTVEAAAFRGRAADLLNSYSSFPKPYKLLIMSAPPNGKDVLFVERYMADPTDGLPRNGLIEVPSESGARLDNHWDDGKSWAFPRYGYLFAVDGGNEHAGK